MSSPIAHASNPGAAGDGASGSGALPDGLVQPSVGTRPAIVVTGASEGIGLAIARAFVVRGHRVLLVAREAVRLDAAVAAVTNVAKGDGEAEALALDVTREDAYGVIARHLEARGLHVDVLINNAGAGLGGDFAAHSVDEIDRLIALNVSSLTRMMHAAISDMKERARGHVINMASLGGYVPGPYQAAYYASKSYVLSLSEAVAQETRGTGIRISVVAPGPADTGFHADMGADQALYRWLLPSLSPDRVAASVYRGYRMGRRVIVPGIANTIMAIALRVMPHVLSVPLTGWLLRPRGGRS